MVVNGFHGFFSFFVVAGSITNIDDDAVKCKDGSSPEIRNKVISGVVGAASSVTSIQVANLLRLFKIPQVNIFEKILLSLTNSLWSVLGILIHKLQLEI